MPGPDFMFAVHVSEGGDFDGMLQDLTGSVMRHAGYAAAAIGELRDQIRAGVAGRLPAGAGADVEFRARGGELEIIVSQGGRIFRASRRLLQ